MHDLIELILQVADDAHVAHLISRNDAEHRALGEFYSDVRDRMDTLAESFIGLNPDAEGLPEVPEPKLRIRMTMEMVQKIRSDSEFESPVLQNQFDELLAVFTRALFKLERLK